MNRFPWIRLTLLSALLGSLTGCGYMTQTNRKVDYSSLAVGARRGLLWQSTDPSCPTCTSEFIASKWGEPDHRTDLGDGTVEWTYHNGLKWVGAAPVLLLPLPLFVPSGREKIHFGIKDNRIIFIRHETTKRNFVYFPLNHEDNIIVGLNNVRVDAYAGACRFEKQP